MDSLAALLNQKFRDLIQQEQPLLDRLAVVRREKEQVRVAAAAAGILLNETEGAPSPSAETEGEPGRMTPEQRARVLTSIRTRRASEATIKQAVVAVLEEAGRGMTALEILPVINARLGIDYPRTSLSPQLSRLKSDGVIERDGIVWSLVRRGEDGRPIPPPPNDADEYGSVRSVPDASELFSDYKRE